jgi:hypothetical protein
MGLGPNFMLKITLQNIGSTPVLNAKLLFAFDPDLYVMGHKGDVPSLHSIPVKMLLPGPKHLCEACVRSIDPMGSSGDVLVLLSNGASQAGSLPLVSASVKMPIAEISL